MQKNTLRREKAPVTLSKKQHTMKKTRKSVQKTITAHIPVELLRQIIADPENISLCHALVSAIITAERIRKPDGAAQLLDESNLHPAPSSEAEAMAEDARRRVEKAKERREARKQRVENRMRILGHIFRDEKPVPLSALFGSGLFTPEQERTVDALLNPTVKRITKLSPEQLWAYFLPLITRFNKIPLSDLPVYERRHALGRK